MDFSVLGPLRVSNGAGPVEVRGAKERTLLAHLVASAGRMVPSSDLIDSLWGDQPPRSAAKSLQTYVLRLRNALEPDRNGSPTVLVTEGPGYRLAVERTAVDAERFAGLVALGRRALADGRAEAAVATLSDALELWRGPAYAGFEATAFGQAEARRLSDMRLAALEDRCAAELELGRASAVVPELERLLGEHPLREGLWALLVLGLYRSGRQGDALAAYDRARGVLADELGVDPGPDLRELHGRVLVQDPTLAAPRRSPSLPPGLVAPADPLVGRDEQLSVLREAWQRAQAGAAVTVCLRGPKGAGATRLAAALAQEVVHSGGAVVLLDGSEGESVPRTGVPLLLVVDHTEPPPPARSTLLLTLAGATATPPEGAQVLDLPPLDAAAVRTIVGQYVDATSVEPVAREVLAASDGWPGLVHEAAVARARSAAARRVEAAAVLTDRSSAALASARADLTEGVTVLHETARRAERSDPGVCPWRGLEWYDVDDAAWFAGRERLVAELVSRLAGTRLLGVVGASGSGKSSAVRAGLLAALADDVLPGSGAWDRILMRPGDHPMRELARQALGTRPVEVGDLLAHLIRTEPGDVATRVVLVVDQLEEAWTACHDAGERTAFLDTLAELASDPRSPVTVVLVVRADYVGELADHPALAQGLTDATVLVGAPTPAEIRRAVERPAGRAALTLDDGLADALVSDAGAEPGLLPLLSTALTRLWEQREGFRLTFAAYVGMGGLSGAIAHLADAAYNLLSTDEQVAARTLFLRLTGPGEGAAVTRRRVPVAELEALPQPGVRRVAEVLAEARLLTVSDGHVEVAHEALFREWPRLRGWLVEDAAGRSVQRRLALAASEWDADGREPGQLWRGTRLVSGLEVAEAHPDEITTTEREFLDAGRAAVDAEQREAEERAAGTARQNRRLRGLLAGLAVLLVVALAAGYLAMRSRAEAEESRADAEAARVDAEAKRLAAAALNEDAPDLALLQAVEAVRMERSPETYGALVTLLAREPQVFTRYRTPERFLEMGVTADGRTALLGENGPALHAVDTGTGRRIWKRPVTDGQVRAITPASAGDQVFLMLASETELGAMIDATDGSDVWRLGVEDVHRAVGTDAFPLLMDAAGWSPDGSLLLPTTTHVLEVDPSSGAVERAVEWPEPVADPESFTTVWGDGRISVAAEEGPTRIFDPEHPRAGWATMSGRVFGHSPRGHRLVAVNSTPAGQVLRLYDSRTLRPVSAPQAVSGFVIEARWSTDGSVLAVGVDAAVQVRDGRTAAEMFEVVPHSGQTMGLDFAGTSDELLWTAARDGTAVGLDVSGRRGMLRSEEIAARPHSGVGASEREVAVILPPTSSWYHPRIFDTRTGRDLFGDLPLAGLEGCDCFVPGVGITPDGQYALGGIEHFQETAEGFVPADAGGQVVVWNTEDGSVEEVVDLPWGVHAIDVTSDSRQAVVQGRTGYAVVDLDEFSVRHETSSLEEVEWFEAFPTVEVSPDGRLAALARGSRILVLDLASGEVIAERLFKGGEEFFAFGWGPKSDALVAGGVKGRLHFLDVADLRSAAPGRSVVAGWVIDLETSPDGSLLASLGTDGDLRLWDTATWRPVGQPLLDELGWGILRFSGPDHLQVFYEVGTRYDVEVNREAWVASGCRAANRELTPQEWAIIRPGVRFRPTCDGVA